MGGRRVGKEAGGRGAPRPSPAGEDGMKYKRKGAYFMAQTRIKWLLSATRDGSDERGLVGGVGEAGEVGGLGVAH